MNQNAFSNENPDHSYAQQKNVAKQSRRRAPLGDISNQAQIVTKNDKNVITKPTAHTTASTYCDGEPEPVDMQIDDDDINELLADEELPVTNAADDVNVTNLISLIDMDDLNDPQLVVEYLDDIFRHYFEVESRHLPPPTYMDMQTDIRPDMRRVLIDWLVEVHTMFNLKPETLFLGINILDRFLSVKVVQRSRLQLVGSAAMFVASKYEEMYAPEVEDFVYVSDKAFNREDVLHCESVVCNRLGFVFSVPTPFHFAQRFAKVAALNERNEHFMYYLMELALLEYSFLKYTPSMIAASAVYLTTYFDATPWNDDLIEHTRYTYATIRPCVKEMYAVLAAGKTSSVRKKYSSKARMRVAQIGQEVVDSQIRQHEQQQQQNAQQ